MVHDPSPSSHPDPPSRQSLPFGPQQVPYRLLQHAWIPFRNTARLEKKTITTALARLLRFSQLSKFATFKCFFCLLLFQWPLRFPLQLPLLNSSLWKSDVPHYLPFHCSRSKAFRHAFSLPATSTISAYRQSPRVSAPSTTSKIISRFIKHFESTDFVHNIGMSAVALHVSRLYSR